MYATQGHTGYTCMVARKREGSHVSQHAQHTRRHVSKLSTHGFGGDASQQATDSLLVQPHTHSHAIHNHLHLMLMIKETLSSRMLWGGGQRGRGEGGGEYFV